MASTTTEENDDLQDELNKNLEVIRKTHELKISGLSELNLLEYEMKLENKNSDEKYNLLEDEYERKLKILDNLVAETKEQQKKMELNNQRIYHINYIRHMILILLAEIPPLSAKQALNYTQLAVELSKDRKLNYYTAKNE